MQCKFIGHDTGVAMEKQMVCNISDRWDGYTDACPEMSVSGVDLSYKRLQ